MTALYSYMFLFRSIVEAVLSRLENGTKREKMKTNIRKRCKSINTPLLTFLFLFALVIPVRNKVMPSHCVLAVYFPSRWFHKHISYLCIGSPPTVFG